MILYATTNATTYNDSSCVQGTRYYYKIEPVNVVGIGNVSNTHMAKLLFNITLDLTVKESDAIAHLTWNSVPTATYYKLYISRDNGSSYEQYIVYSSFGKQEKDIGLYLGYNWYYVEAYTSNNTLIGESDVVQAYYYPFSQKLQDFLNENGIYLSLGGILTLIAILLILSQRGKLKKSTPNSFYDF